MLICSWSSFIFIETAQFVNLMSLSLLSTHTGLAVIKSCLCSLKWLAASWSQSLFVAVCLIYLHFSGLYLCTHINIWAARAAGVLQSSDQPRDKRRPVCHRTKVWGTRGAAWYTTKCQQSERGTSDWCRCIAWKRMLFSTKTEQLDKYTHK